MVAFTITPSRAAVRLNSGVRSHMQNIAYDIAISFLARDEGIATKLYSELSSRAKVFLYSKAQERLAGTDGEIAFGKVFSEESRVVVVLYRDEWGTTPWTRIEETAIRNRGFEHGYDFCLFMPLNTPPSVPTWLPKNRIWIGLDRWGIEGAASVIDARVQELGGTPRVESLGDMAKRVELRRTQAETRARYRKSHQAVEDFKRESKVVKTLISQRCAELSKDNTSLGFHIYRGENQTVVSLRDRWLDVDRSLSFGNSIDGAKLEATIGSGPAPIPGAMHFHHKPRAIRTFNFTPDCDSDGNFMWNPNTSSQHLIGSDACANKIIALWLESLE